MYDLGISVKEDIMELTATKGYSWREHWEQQIYTEVETLEEGVSIGFRLVDFIPDEILVLRCGSGEALVWNIKEGV